MPQQLSLDGLTDSARPTDRLFYGIFPPPAIAGRFAQLAQGLSARHGLTGRPLAGERFHITLFHLGDYCGLPAALARTAIEAAATVSLPPFEVRFDHAASFAGKSPSLPLVLRASTGVDRLMAFQQTLGVALKKAGLGRHVGPSFTPHVTLLYDAKLLPPEPVEPVAWVVNEFVLVHSLLRQTRHVPLERWPLRQG
jgi:2'-5' RNA ligase